MANNRSTDSTGIADSPNNPEQQPLDKINHKLSVENHLPESNADKASRVAEQKDDTNKLVNSGVLPKVDLVASDVSANLGDVKELQDHPETMPAKVASASDLNNGINGIADAASEVAKGAMEELTQHPERVAANVAIGAGVTAAIAFAPVWVGGAAIVGGGAYAAYELSKNVPNWINQFGTVADASNHSQREVQAAREGLQGLGSGAVDVTAGFAGGVAAGAISARFLGAPVEAALTMSARQKAAANLAERQGVEFVKPVGELNRDLLIKYGHSLESPFKQKAALNEIIESGGWYAQGDVTAKGTLKISQGCHKVLGAKNLGMADSDIPITVGNDLTTLARAKEQLGLPVDPGSLRIGESALNGTLLNSSTNSFVDAADSYRKFRQGH